MTRTQIITELRRSALEDQRPRIGVDWPETIAQLLRKIERLEAQNAALHLALSRNAEHNREDFIARADAQVRIKQAVRILQGEE